MVDSTLKNANILIVDDQIANIDILEDFLSMQGYLNLQTTTDPREVVNLFFSFEPDLILLDLSMPYLSGFEVMTQLRSHILPDVYLPILVLTADVTSEAKQRALSEGANDFLIKPFDLIEVGLRIKNLLYTSYLQQQQKKQNQLLEIKVQERTIDLDRTNKELIIAKEKAEASDRLKTAFILNISHEIRTPLNGILGFAELLSNDEVSTEQKQKFLPMLEISSSRLLNTITDYMDMSLIVSDNMVINNKTIKIADILKEIKNRFETLNKTQELKLELNYSENDVDFKFQTDPKLFEKIIFHLLDNAVKFTSEGSVAFGFEVKEATIVFYFKDTGVGISEESHEKIFKLFMQEDNTITKKHEGSGLGLSVVSGLLKLLGGKIQLESKKGEGSTFYIELPLNNTIQKQIENKITNNVSKTENLPIILVVEDDYANYMYMETVLENHTSKLFYAEDGRKAVELCQNHPEISMVLMDIRMPVMNGLDATREIKLFKKDLPIVAFTAYAVSGDERKVFEAGCDGYLTKPASKDQILEKIMSFGFKI